MTTTNPTNVEQESNTTSDGIREDLRTTHGHERRQLDIGGDDHDLAGMSQERKAPIESVAKNVVNRYDEKKAFIREFLANSHTACIQRAKYMIRDNGDTDDVAMNDVKAVLDYAKEHYGYEPLITVAHNQNPSEWTLRIADNGIGVPRERAEAIRDIGLSGWHMDGSTNGQFGQGTMSGFQPVSLHGEFHMVTNAAETDHNYRVAWKLTDLNPLPGKRSTVGTTFEWPTFTNEARDKIDVKDAVTEYSKGMIIPIRYEEYDEDGKENGNSDEFLPKFMEDRYPDDSLVLTYEDDFGKVVWSPDDPEDASRYGSSLDTYCGYQPIDRNDGIGTPSSYQMPSGFDMRLKVEDGSIIGVKAEGDDSYNTDHELVGRTPLQRQAYDNKRLSTVNVHAEHLVEDENVGYVVVDGPYEDKIAVESERMAKNDSDLVHVSNVDGTVLHDTPIVATGKYQGRRIADRDEWQSLDFGRIESEFVPYDEIPDDVETLEAPKPTDDRDRFESEHVSDVCRYYSECLWDELRQLTADVYQSVSCFDDILELDGNDLGLFIEGMQRFASTRHTTGEMQDVLEDEFGVDYSEELCQKMKLMQKRVELAPRSAGGRATKKDYRRKKQVWKVYRMANDGDTEGDVYMAYHLTKKKMKLAWELDDENVVVQAAGKRDELNKAFGWKDLTDLPSTGLRTEFPDHDFSDDFVEMYERSTSSSSSGGSLFSEDVDSGFDHERAKKRKVTVRCGTGNSRWMKEHTGEEIFETLDNGNNIKAGRKSYTTLILYDNDCNVDVGTKWKSYGAAYAVVPDYVKDYLLEADNIMTESEYRSKRLSETVEHDWSNDGVSTRTIGQLSSKDVLAVVDKKVLDVFQQYGIESELHEAIREAAPNDVRSITYVGTYFDKCMKDFSIVLDRGAPIELKSEPVEVNVTAGTSYSNHAVTNIEELFFDSVLPDLDRSAPEWGYFDVSMDDENMVTTMQRLMDAGGFVSTDDDPNVPFDVDDDYEMFGPEKRRYGNVSLNRQDLYVAKTLERLDDAGGFVDDGGDA